MNTVSLRKMAEAEFVTWMAYSIDEYAKDKMKALGIDKAEALVLSNESFSHLLSDGFATADNYFFMILQDGAVCGWLWFSIKSEWGVTSAFVYDLEIVPKFRRHGIASVAMGLLEAEVKVLGASKIALHVFGQNEGARDLYAKVGYRVTDYSMAKDVG
ncbi:MAG: GNAT family N-acetyltransferase [Paracoccaceae bacterium]|jgi:ribosomal protein S18 acetylase RimI-like enzyme